MRYQAVRLGDVLTDGPGAGGFSFSFEPDIDELSKSINECGLVRPPLLRKKGAALEVVCGFRRVLACKSLGLSEIEALVCESDELSREKCLWISLIDNDPPGRLSPVECAIALTKFSEAGYGANRLAGEIAPMLGLPPSRRYVEDYTEMLSLEREVLRAVHDGSFGVEQALCLRRLEKDARLPVFGILRSCKANLNETRELVSLIPDVAAIRGVSVSALVESELAAIAGDESTPPRKRLERLRTSLRCARYPRLTETESAFEREVDAMRLGERCRINPPKHFEGDEITITVRAESADSVEKVLASLSSPETRDGLRKLFAIIRGSENR